ncbi:DNA polymerase III subunit delta [Maritimibacter sp. DP1N21-5]|uniref:DNA polymerase III subunit delta n=1 Tax=Maritimibacter sp. DP1N21-5 TaxID=2836867 RepID=UPI001C493998|nr:DNA polymerase III subunit delta [Maritimibacter sp. DP1N21-5]MBV7408831.1 DNA polymerase III subunit delta [Maritimibacter sp. DP1N21-5]
MKLKPAEAARYFAKPDPDKMGVLIYGTDAMRVALKRQELIENLLGPTYEQDMRLTRMTAGDLKSDPTRLLDAIKEIGFFPGPRAVFVEDMTDLAGKDLGKSLDEWVPGDAAVIITGGNMKPTGALRKYFETHPSAYAVGIYDDPPTREEIQAELGKKGLTNIDREAMTDIEGLSRTLDPGDFRQTMEKLSLYKLGDPAPVSPADVLACAPATTEAELDDVLHATAEGRAGDLGPLLTKLEAQGLEPVRLAIAMTMHFRTLHMAASDPEGPGKGIFRARPPVHFKSRDRMIRQAGRWGVNKLESALDMIVDADLTLRSASKAPGMALMERTLIRLAYMAGR